MAGGIVWFSLASLLLPLALSAPVQAAGLTIPALLLARCCVVSRGGRPGARAAPARLDLYWCSSRAPGRHQGRSASQGTRRLAVAPFPAAEPAAWPSPARAWARASRCRR